MLSSNIFSNIKIKVDVLKMGVVYIQVVKHLKTLETVETW